MSKCKLDLDNPKFRIIGSANDADRDAGLRELRDKVAKDHKLCHFIIHPMPGFPDYHNKIWKWDFAPAGQTSSTRAGWRLLAYVPVPSGDEPIEAIAFVCWDKEHEPSGNPAKFIAKKLKEFLAETIAVQAVESKFRRQTHPDGRIRLAVSWMLRGHLYGGQRRGGHR